MLTGGRLSSIFLSTLWATQLTAQNPAQPTSRLSSRLISIQVTQAIDSTRAAAGTSFTGKVVNAVNAGGQSIQAGATATLTLTQTTVPGVSTGIWSLALTAPVSARCLGSSGGSGVGGYLGGLGIPSGFGGFGRKKAQNNTSSSSANTANNTVQTSGTKVFVPANTTIQCTMAQGGAPVTTSSTGVNQPRVAPVNQGQPAAVLPAATAAPTPSSPQNAFGRNRNQVQPGNAPGQQTSSTVVWDNVQYALQGCHRQAPHIVCEVQITNLATADATLTANGASYYVDQIGNKVQLNNATVANCSLLRGCLAINGIAMPGKFVFLDENSQATTLVRLQIQARGGPIQFSNVPVN
jgi:hypothetical protein